jgi:hypothetical protein
MAKDRRLLKLTPLKGRVPTVADVGSGAARVYWHESQTPETAEPPGYNAPAGWPVALTLFRRPRCFRLLTRPGTGGPEDECRSVTRTVSPPSEEFPVYIATFCTCDTSGAIVATANGVDLTAQTFTAANVSAASGIPGYTEDDEDLGECEGATGTGRAADWRAAANALTLPNRVGRNVSESLPANYLSPASVAAADVPVDPADRLFIGGECLTVLVFTNDKGKDAYSAGTVAASDVGTRIAAAYPGFLGYRTVLLADTGSTSLDATLADQLEGVAAALADYGVLFLDTAGDPAAVLAELVDNFFGG